MRITRSATTVLAILATWALGTPAAWSQSQSPPAADAPRTVPVLILEQEVRGIPGMAPESVSRQRIALDAADGRLTLEAIPREEAKSGHDGARTTRPAAATNVGLTESGINRVVLRLDESPRRITEISDAHGFYQTRELTQLSKLQEDRDVMEASIIQFARRRSEEEQDKILSRSFLKPDGSRHVTVIQGGAETILGYRCRETKVMENGRLIIHAWITPQLDAGTTFYELYQGLGALSKDVLDKVRELKGLPLRAKIRVVTAAPAYVLEATCTKITKATIRVDRFDVPKGYREIQEEKGIVPCPICGADVEWDEPGGGIHIDPFTKKETRTCSPKCREEMKARLRKKRDRLLGR